MLNETSEMERSVARIKEGKTFFIEKMRSLGFAVLPTAGNFTHVAFGERGRVVHSMLTKKVYYRQSFTQPCLADYSRFTIAPKPIMEQVVDMINQAVK
jgi:histidinol-phosphate aminotransferase